MNTAMRISVTLLILSLVAPLAAAAAPSVGDVYVYRVVNGYSKETRAVLRSVVERSDAGGVTLSVGTEPPGGLQWTEIYTQDGNWLMHPVDSHGWKVNYLFASSYPAYVFPLAGEKPWSLRINATADGDPRTRSVRVDGRVVGSERIRVPAGEFDTVKVERITYPGDVNFSQTETHVIETDWYAPALGRAVRTERKSRWQEPSRCGRGGCVFFGDWDVIELIEVRPARG